MSRDVRFEDLEPGDGLFLIGRDGQKIAKYRVVKVEFTGRFVYARLERWIESNPNDVEVAEHFLDRTKSDSQFGGQGIMLMEADRKYLRKAKGRKRRL